MPLAALQAVKDRPEVPRDPAHGQGLAGGFLSKRRPSTSQRLLFQKAQLSIWYVRIPAHKYPGLSLGGCSDGPTAPGARPEKPGVLGGCSVTLLPISMVADDWRVPHLLPLPPAASSGLSCRESVICLHPETKARGPTSGLPPCPSEQALPRSLCPVARKGNSAHASLSAPQCCLSDNTASPY